MNNEIKLPIEIKKGTINRISSITGLGKTTLAIQLCNEIMKRNKDYYVLHLDLEMFTSIKRLSMLVDKEQEEHYHIIQEHRTIDWLCKGIEKEDNCIIIIDKYWSLEDKDNLYKLKEKIKGTNNIVILIDQLDIDGKRKDIPEVDNEITIRRIPESDLVLVYYRDKVSLPIYYTNGTFNKEHLETLFR